jgi:hypothetical protein
MFTGMGWGNNTIGNGTILKKVTRIATEYRKTDLITETWLASNTGAGSLEGCLHRWFLSRAAEQ